MSHSRLRRGVALAALAFALAVPVTAGCGVQTQRAANHQLPTQQLSEVRNRLERNGPIELPATTPPPPGQAGTMTDFVKIVMDDVGTFWGTTFANAGLQYQTTNYVILDDGAAPMQSACGGPPATADDGPFYCSQGGALPGGSTSEPIIYVGAPWLSQAMSGVGSGNYDFAVASVIAHEFGHHVQHELGLSRTELPGKFQELSADCLGGVWSYAAYQNGQLDAGDIDEALMAAWSAGSDQPDDDGPDPHGTREERVNAFSLGYSGGNPATCLQG